MSRARYHGFTWDEIGDEEWRVCASAPNYEVSELGQVRNAHTLRVLQPVMNPSGYLYVGIAGPDRRQRTQYIHRLVATAFLPPAPPNYTVDHLDGDKRNNRASNLEWCTGLENSLRHTLPLSHSPV